MRRNYLDTGTFVASWRGEPEDQRKADALFEDPDEWLIASEFTRLELAENGNTRLGEASYMEGLMGNVDEWVPVDDRLVARATALRTKHDGLAAIDAMHVAAAERAVADRFVTSEKETKPLYKATNVNPIRVSSLTY